MLNVSPRHREYETLPGLNNIAIPAATPLPTAKPPTRSASSNALATTCSPPGCTTANRSSMSSQTNWSQLAEFVKADPQLAYEALIDVSAVDRLKLPIAPRATPASTLVYQLRSYARKQHLIIVARCQRRRRRRPAHRAQPGPRLCRAPTGRSAKCYDLMGITFTGHPDLRRILMPEHWPNHPLRKDMPVGGEEVPFSLTWGDPEFETLGKQILPAESVAPTVPPGMNREHMIINMGPHHPSTHGVLRLVVELDGEDVVNVDPDLGYLHSGFEKTGENKRYKDFVYYTDRMDYLSAMSNNLGYVLAVEKMLGIEVPQRAQVIRVIMAELQRIASHLFWLSTHVLDVSGTGMSLLMYATRERERILDLFEMACGARLTISYIRIGGVWKDLPAAFITQLARLARHPARASSTTTRPCSPPPRSGTNGWRASATSAATRPSTWG